MPKLKKHPKDERYRVRNVPREIQIRFHEAAKKAGMTVGPALVEAMDAWIKKQEG